MIRIISRIFDQPEWFIRADGDPVRLEVAKRTYVRILLAGMSNMLSDIVTAAIAQAPDIVVAGQVGESEDLAERIGLTRADAVIIQANQPGGAEGFVPLLRGFSALKLIVIDGNCSGGFLLQLHPHSIRLRELSADLLQAALRAQISVTWETDWDAVPQSMRAENRGAHLGR